MDLVLGSGNAYDYCCTVLAGKKFVAVGPKPYKGDKEEILFHWFPLSTDAEELHFISSIRVQGSKFNRVFLCLDGQSSTEVELMGCISSYLLCNYLKDTLFRYVAILKSLCAFESLLGSVVTVVVDFDTILYEHYILDSLYYNVIEDTVKDITDGLHKIFVGQKNPVGYSVLKEILESNDVSPVT